MTDYSNDIKRYLNGEMKGAERNAFEKKALSDPFLAEALEGAEELSSEEFMLDISNLNKRIKEAELADTGVEVPLNVEGGTSKSGNAWRAWRWPARIAAGLVVIFLSGYFIWQLSNPVDEPSPLAFELKDSPVPIQQEIDQLTDSSSASEGENPVVSEKPKQAAAGQAAQSSPKPIAKLEDKQTDAVQEITALDHSQPTITEEKIKDPVVLAESERPVNETFARSANEDAAKKQAVSRAKSAAIPANIIRGKVTSKEDGSTLPGVNVTIKGTTMGTITDVNGNYQIETSSANPVLVFSFIGLNTLELQTESGKEASVQLAADVSQLSEVVVVGYGASRSEVAPTVDLTHPATGNRAFKQYLEKNIVYPEEAKTRKVEGRVTVEFFVETDGSLSGFTVVRGIGSGCDEELIRLIQQGPAWIPTKKDGVPIRDKARVRLKFDLPK